jgi:hypothetical protein
MTQLGRRFGLSDVSGNGVSCDENGAFVGEVPLLEQPRGTRGLEPWRPRPVSDLNRDLGKRYGLPVECDAKIGGLAAIARALDRGDLFHAQIATLHLQIPDPPPPTQSAKTRSEIVDLARQLQASGLLKAGWDPTKHPPLAGRKPRRRRWRVRTRRQYIGRVHSWRFECATHAGPTYNSRTARCSRRNSISVRDIASAGSAAEYQSSYHSEKSLPGAAKVREGMG